jgi:activator of 2-hydroxyglutaryl-CoA dehydratase
VAGIIRGAFLSVVDRVLEMDPLIDTVVLTGGVVAYNPTIAEILSERVGRKLEVSPYPQFTGALGAALIAAKRSGTDQPSASGDGLPAGAGRARILDPDKEEENA